MSLPYIIEESDKGDKTYEIYSRLLRDRIVFIQGEFNDHMANGVIAQLLYLQSDNPEKDIYMYINSPGGSISSMYAIYDVMNYVTPEINTVGIGTVASAGSFILAAGAPGKRSCLENTVVMIHELSSGMQGKANDLFVAVDHTKKLYEKMAKHYVEFTGQKLRKVKKDMQRDHYLSSNESLAYGLIDQVVKKV